MVKRLNIDNSLFLDLDKILYMQIEEYGNPVKSDHGFMLQTAYRVLAVSDTGVKFPVFVDNSSGKSDTCVNWISKNWLK